MAVLRVWSFSIRVRQLPQAASRVWCGCFYSWLCSIGRAGGGIASSCLIFTLMVILEGYMRKSSVNPPLRT